MLLNGVNGDTDGDGDVEGDDFECMYFGDDGRVTNPMLVPRQPSRKFGYGNTDSSVEKDTRGIAAVTGTQGGGVARGQERRVSG